MEEQRRQEEQKRMEEQRRQEEQRKHQLEEVKKQQLLALLSHHNISVESLNFLADSGLVQIHGLEKCVHLLIEKKGNVEEATEALF